MSYADPALLDARNYLIGRGISGNAIGIVGDQSHQSSGGYHVGNDVLAQIGKLNTDYSKRQTDKDRPGSNAAMALDIGDLSGQALYELTNWLIAQCKAGTPDSRNIREIIGRESPAGGIIHYDALGLQDGEPAGHDAHTHISYYRDSEGQDKTSLFRRYYEGDPVTPQAEPGEIEGEEDTMLIVYLFAKATGSKPNRWGLGVASGGRKFWFEGDSQSVGNAYVVTQKVSATEVSDADYEEQKAQFVGTPA